MKNLETNSELAFINAINIGLFSDIPTDDNYAGNYMYMHTDDGRDYFKETLTREYTSCTTGETLLEYEERTSTKEKKTFSFWLDWHSSIEEVEAETKEEAEQILQDKVLKGYERYVPTEFEIHYNEEK